MDYVFLFFIEGWFWYVMQITIFMKHQRLWSGENKKQYFEMSFAEFFTQHVEC